MCRCCSTASVCSSLNSDPLAARHLSGSCHASHDKPVTGDGLVDDVDSQPTQKALHVVDTSSVSRDNVKPNMNACTLYVRYTVSSFDNMSRLISMYLWQWHCGFQQTVKRL